MSDTVRVTAIGEENYKLVSSLLNLKASHIHEEWHDIDYVSREDVEKLKNLSEKQYYVSEYED